MQPALLGSARVPVSVGRRDQRAGARVSARPRQRAGGCGTSGCLRRRGHRRQSVRAKASASRPRATAVISLFMGGGWSQMDTFDPKPALKKYAGQPIDGKVRGDVIVRQGFPGPLMPSPFSFGKYGQSGIEVSEIFPHLSQHVDEIAFLRSVFGRSNDHVQGTYEMQTGQINLGFPSVGFVGHLRPGIGGVEPAGVCGDDRRARRSARRAERLERRLHARGASGDVVSLDRRSDCRSQASRRHEPGGSARPPRCAGEAQRTRHAEIPGQQRAGGAHLVVRARLPDAGVRAEARSISTASRRRRRSSTDWIKRSRSRTDGNA